MTIEGQVFMHLRQGYALYALGKANKCTSCTSFALEEPQHMYACIYM